ncbi:hypothetical protein C8Q80DRAFT_176290 [Daedaleopsis nitida]|nr:hypothetical protein C8Q80DRAFT_176290 [Daedaleopsis nitida]
MARGILTVSWSSATRCGERCDDLNLRTGPKYDVSAGCLWANCILDLFWISPALLVHWLPCTLGRETMVDDGGLSTSQAWDDLRNELFARDKRKMSSEEGICWKEQYSELLKRGKWPEEAEAGWYDKDMLQIIDHLHPVLRKNDLLELVQDYTLTSRGTYLRYRKQNLDEINARIRATKADSADPTDPGKKREERAWLEAQKKTSQLMYQKANAQSSKSRKTSESPNSISSWKMMKERKASDL